MDVSKNKILDMAKEGGALNKPAVMPEPAPMIDNTMMQDEFLLYKLSQLTISELTARIQDEYKAHYHYRNAANWCQDQNYAKAAAFFKAEADNELEHAEMLQKYMTDFNIIPEIKQAPIGGSFTSLPEIVRESYKIELQLMHNYTGSSAKLFTMDLITFDFLQQFRNIQSTSVIEYNDLINALNLINENNKFEVLYFEQTYF